MTRITEIMPFEDNRWDEFVFSHPFGWISHSTGWMRVLSRSFRHLISHVLVLENEGKIEAGLPLYEVRSWLFGNRLISIPFSTFSEPLVSSRNEFEMLFEKAVEVMGVTGCSRIEIGALQSALFMDNTKLGANCCQKRHALILDSSPETLLKKFDRSCVRQKIAKSKANGLLLKNCSSVDDVRIFYKLHLMTRRERQGLPPKPYIFFQSIFDILSPMNNASILLCQKDGETIAGVLLLKFKTRVSIEVAAYDSDYIHLCPLHFLFWESIKNAIEEHYEVIDFGSTPEWNKGLMDFKKRWGTSLSDIPKFHYPKEYAREKEREDSRPYRVIQFLSRRMPSSVLEVASHFIYNHLG